MTKQDIIKSMKKRFNQASPGAKYMFFNLSNLGRRKKSELQHYLDDGQVTINGDLNFVKNKNRRNK